MPPHNASHSDKRVLAVCDVSDLRPSYHRQAGLLPSKHGVRDNIGFKVAKGAWTLATELKQARYCHRQGGVRRRHECSEEAARMEELDETLSQPQGKKD